MMNVKKILISQAEPETGKSPYYDIAGKHGAKAFFVPLFHIESVSTREFRDQKISILDHSAIIFNSRKAMEHFFEMIEELRITMPDTMKYFCASEQIANYLQKFITYRKRKVFYPEIANQNKLIELIAKHNKETYFIPLSEGHSKDFTSMLEDKKIKFSIGIMYRTVSDKFPEGDAPENYDMLVFFAPASITSFMENYPDFKQGDIKIASFGPMTTQAVEEAGLRVDLAAPTEAFQSMAMAMDHYLGKKK